MADKAKVKFEEEEDLYYINKVTEKKISFKRSLDQAVITFQPDLSFTKIKQIFINFFINLDEILEIINLRYGFAVISIPRIYETFQFLKLLSFSSRIANVTTTKRDNEDDIRYFLPDEFTVQFQENLSDTEMSNIYVEKGCKERVKQKKKGYFTLTVPENKGLFETIREFSSLQEVVFSEYCEVGTNASSVYIPRSRRFNRGEQWGLYNIKETLGHSTRGIDIKALEAWQIERGKENVVIVVIDTGVKGDSILKDNILFQGEEDRDFATPSKVPEPSLDLKDPQHGTIVASIAAAPDTNNFIGVAPECKIMPLKVNIDAGRYPDLVDAFNHVKLHADRNPNNRYIINCSWSINGDNGAIRRIIELCINSSIVIVVAASNRGANLDRRPKYPMSYNDVIVVGAIDEENKVAKFNLGSSAYGSKVVWAPGKKICALGINGILPDTEGTSVAAPFVSGLAALILSKNSNLSNLEVAKIIKETAESIVNDNEDFLEERRRSGETEISRESLGVGRINAIEALKKTPNL